MVVLAPHPDDEILGCGGMLAFHAERGDAPLVVFLSDGAVGDPDAGIADLPNVRRAEAAAALGELGVARVEHLGFPDGALEASRELRRRVESVLERERAELVYAPSLLECHADHLAAAEAASLAAAARPTTRVHLYGVNTAVPANELYDVSRYRARKDAALARYRSQLGAIDLLRVSRALDGARSVNIPYGTVTDCEGFLALDSAALPDADARLRALRDLLFPSTAP